MAGTSDKYFTMQGSVNPVSASGQGEKAGPQASSSSDCSSSVVGNLATGECPITRSNSHLCNKNPDLFCYICGEFEPVKNRRMFSDRLKKCYEDCFRIQITNLDSAWVPHFVCGRCHIMLTRWEKNKTRENLKFTIPMTWTSPTSSHNCYFCMTEIAGFTSSNRSKIIYANVSSAVKPQKTVIVDETEALAEMEVEKEEVPMEEEEEEDEEEEEEIFRSENPKDKDFMPDKETKDPETFSREELNDLIRDLNLPKDGAELLASRLKHKNLLAQKVTAYFYRNREEEFRKFFTKDDENSVVFCSNVKGLVDEFIPDTYKDDEWRLFIDSSTRSLKAVLLHISNILAPIPIAHSTKLKETYENLGIVLDKIKYSEHQWQICGDLKIATLLLGQQSGFTKYPCYLCLWDSRDRKNHYVKKEWPTRVQLNVGRHNVIRTPLIQPSNYLLPPLHIKLGLIKQYVKALDKDGDCFQYLRGKFPAISDAKLKEGIFNGPQIRTLFQDTNFPGTMNDTERAAWVSFKNVCQNFLGNNKSENYRTIVEELVTNYKHLGCLMNLKLHFLDSHIDHFPENLGDYSEEQGERFHQDISEMETRYQGNWNINMMADYCWTLKRDIPKEDKKRKRNPLRRSFENKRVRYHRKTV